ncbi:MAG: hypothetical protein ACWA5R_06540 [bacterium]
MNNIKKRVAMVACIFLSITVVGQASDETIHGSGSGGCDDLSVLPSKTEISYERDVQSIFNNQCTVCHGGASPTFGLNLEAPGSFDNIVGVPTNHNTNFATLRVASGDPAHSFLLAKINCDSPEAGNRMPNGGPAMNILLQKRIEDWINQGTPWFKSGFEDN